MQPKNVGKRASKKLCDGEPGAIATREDLKQDRQPARTDAGHPQELATVNTTAVVQHPHGEVKKIEPRGRGAHAAHLDGMS